MRGLPPYPARCLVALLAGVLLPLSLAQNQDKSNQKDEPGQKDQADDEPVYDLAKDITPPRLIHQVAPSYDTGSRGVRVSGKVVIRLIVTSHGLPKDPTILEGLAPEVDQSALAAVKQWRFAPATRQGASVAVRVVVELSFHAM